MCFSCRGHESLNFTYGNNPISLYSDYLKNTRVYDDQHRCKSQMLPFRLRFCFHLSVLTTTKITPTVCPQRTTSGQCCIIPFTYKGVTYNSCTDADHHRLWCSLDSQYKGTWDYFRKYNLMTQWHHR